jgi:hypothetical protein
MIAGCRNAANALLLKLLHASRQTCNDSRVWRQLWRQHEFAAEPALLGLHSQQVKRYCAVLTATRARSRCGVSPTDQCSMLYVQTLGPTRPALSAVLHPTIAPSSQGRRQAAVDRPQAPSTTRFNMLVFIHPTASLTAPYHPTCI